MILLLVLAAFIVLAAGTTRQSQLLFGHAPPPARRGLLLAGGFMLLLLSLALQIDAADAPRRAVAWFGDLSLAALLVVMALWISTLVRRRRNDAVHPPRRRPGSS